MIFFCSFWFLCWCRVADGEFPRQIHPIEIESIH